MAQTRFLAIESRWIRIESNSECIAAEYFNSFEDRDNEMIGSSVIAELEDNETRLQFLDAACVFSEDTGRYGND